MFDAPLAKDVVLIGGGHTHALFLRMWGMNPIADVRITVIDPNASAAYSGMLPGFVAGHYDRHDLGIDLVRLCRFAGARLVLGAAEHIDISFKTIVVGSRPDIAYDLCSIDVGITSEMPEIPGFLDHAHSAKPLAKYAKAWNAFRGQNIDPNIVVIGGGVAGVELAMAMQHALPAAKTTVIDRSKILTAMSTPARKSMTQAIAQHGITVREDTDVSHIEPSNVYLADGTQLDADFIVGAAGAKPYEWLGDSGLEIDGGYLTVSPFLQTSDPDVFAVGDCANLAFDPRPKAGVFAVRQAPILFRNIRAKLLGRKLNEYKPQTDYLKLISLGGKSALAEKFGRSFQGPLLWHWKNRIDQAFMRKFSKFPKMRSERTPILAGKGGDTPKPLCAGCGSKVGKNALQKALNGLAQEQRDDVVILPGDDAGLIRIGDQKQVITTDHLRAFVDDPVLMTRIAAEHALGDIWAMGAAPQAVTAHIVVPFLTEALQQRTLREIMQTATDVFSGVGATIVGGHTTMGAEYTIGFTITGLCEAAPISLAGAKAGDALILTKPIGTGVILAAEMAGRAEGHHVALAYEHMGQSQQRAAEILRNAHAMTDVTGFGLLGHLWGMVEASKLTAHLSQNDIPFLDGATTLAAMGEKSSLFEGNVASIGSLEGVANELLFDPQTSGGLLAALPKQAAKDCVTVLKEAGYRQAAIIGELSSGKPKIKVG